MAGESACSQIRTFGSLGPYRGYLRYHLGLVIQKDAQGREQAVQPMYSRTLASSVRGLTGFEK